MHLSHVVQSRTLQTKLALKKITWRKIKFCLLRFSTTLTTERKLIFSGTAVKKALVVCQPFTLNTVLNITVQYFKAMGKGDTFPYSETQKTTNEYIFTI